MINETNRSEFQAMLERKAASNPKEKSAKESKQNRSFHIDQERYHRLRREEDLKDQEIREQEKFARIERNIAEWRERVGARWADARIENITVPQNKEAILDRIHRVEHGSKFHSNEISMVIRGTMGRGKTYLGYVYAFELIRRGLLLPSQVYIQNEQHLANIMSSGYEQNRMLNELCSEQYKFYLIDDVGRGKYSQAVDRYTIWHHLVDHVYSQNIPIVVTTNLLGNKVEGRDDKNRAARISEWIGDSAVDRLRSIVGATGTIVMTGEDMRTKVAQESTRNIRR